MRRLSFLTLLFSLFTLATTATPKYVTTTELERGEKWWGVFVSGAPLEPFIRPFSINTADAVSESSYTPMMISSNGRYLWSSHPAEISFDGTRIVIGSDYEEVKVLKGGRTLRDAYLLCCHKNFPPQGKIPDADLFTLPVYDTETEFGYMQTQEELLAYAEKLLTEGFPAGILLISDGWRSASREYNFDRAFYPDPKGMIERLHQLGFKVMLTITPYAPAFGRTYVSDVKKGWFVRNTEDKPVITENEGGFSACYDLSDPEQARMIQEGLQRLKEYYAVDGFRFDCRAVMPSLSSLPGKKEAFMTQWIALGNDYPLCEYLPGLNQPFTPYVNGIENHNEYNWESIRKALNDMISAGLLGHSYCHLSFPRHDLSELPRDEKLLASALQQDLFMPVANVEFAPWRITDRTLYTAVKEAIGFRTSLAEYLRETVSESARTGEPIIRHMEYQFPRNGFADCNDQFMLGAKYLFIPNTNDVDKRTVRLPRGVWTDREGQRFRGPVVLEVDCSDGRMHWYELDTK